MIYVIDDDEIMADCIVQASGVKDDVRVFTNAIEAARAIDEKGIPDLIFLDILLDGPDGFTLLNELVSYADTVQIPVVVVSSLDLTGRDLKTYGVVEILNKNIMTPADIKRCVERYCESGS